MEAPFVIEAGDLRESVAASLQCDGAARRSPHERRIRG
jgi:hypothetical protein